MSLPTTRDVPQRRLAHGDRWARLRAFFRFHGVWSPGVRLLRNWSLRAKMGLVLAMTGLPLLAITWHLLAAQHGAVKLAESRLAGTRLADAVAAFGGSFHDEWQALLDGRPVTPVPREGLHRALLAAVAAARSAGLDIDDVWHAQAAVFERARVEPGGSPSARIALLGQAMEGVQGVHRRAVQTSGALLLHDDRLKARAILAFEDLPALQVDLVMQHAALLQRARLLEREPRPAAELRSSLVAVAGLLEGGQRQLARAESQLAWLQVASGPAGAAQGPPLAAVRAQLGHLRAAGVVAEEPIDVNTSSALSAAARNETLTLRLALSSALQSVLETQRVVAARARLALGLLLLGATALSLYAFYSLYLVLHGGLQQLHLQVNRIAEGDLRARPVPRGHDEVAHTMTAMGSSLAGLSELLTGVREGVSVVGQAAQQLTAVSAQHRAGATRLEQLVSGLVAQRGALSACGCPPSAGWLAGVRPLQDSAAQGLRLADQLDLLSGALHSQGERLAHQLAPFKLP